MDAPWLMLGDCLERMEEIPDGSVDLLVTDPPYRVIGGGTSSNLAAGWKGSVLSKNDGKIFAHNDITPEQYMPELHRVLKNGGDAYVMTNNLNLERLLTAGRHAGFKFHGVLVWMKNNCTANRWYMKNLELTCYFFKPPAQAIRHMGSKQSFAAANPINKLHPTEKPISLMEHYIVNSSDAGATVLDPFMGAGSTGVACINTGRNFIGIERDPRYFTIATNRIAEAAEPPEQVGMDF